MGSLDGRVAIITGAGEKAFCAGADIKSFRPPSDDDGPRPEPGKVLRADTVWKPFIAAINGYALAGACELAQLCDIKIASENAVLGEPEIRFGTGPPVLITPPAVGTPTTRPRPSVLIACAKISAFEKLLWSHRTTTGLLHRA